MQGNAAEKAGDPQAAIVALRDVRKQYGEVLALKSLSLDIRRGEFLTLLGPSGCGKTTTLRLISGFELPQAGTIHIDGRCVNDVPPFDRDVNTVFQSYALFPHLTVAGNVGYGLRVKRLPRAVIQERVGAMLERVGLADKAGRYPRELSGGQMQRVALARALINEPRVLLLDEPLGALDAKLRRAMQMELRRMHRDLGITFVCVTHDQEEALVMSDRLGIMHDGELVQLGTPQEVFEKPRTSFVADFIGGCNFLPATVEPDGALKLDRGVCWAAGDQGSARPVTLALRHRKLRLGAASAPDMLGLDTVVRDIAYVGSVRRLLLETAGGSEILAELDAEAVAGTELSPGSPLPISIRREDLIVYDEQLPPGRGH